jgi:hypothetical protein
MKQSVSGDINSDPVLRSRVYGANQILAEILGPASSSVNAGWSTLRHADGTPLIQLALSDSTGAEEVKFTPEHFANEEYLRAKFYKIWGDLLQNRSHKQLELLSGRIPSGK